MTSKRDELTRFRELGRQAIIAARRANVRKRKCSNVGTGVRHD